MMVTHPTGPSGAEGSSKCRFGSHRGVLVAVPGSRARTRTSSSQLSSSSRPSELIVSIPEACVGPVACHGTSRRREWPDEKALEVARDRRDAGVGGDGGERLDGDDAAAIARPTTCERADWPECRRPRRRARRRCARDLAADQVAQHPVRREPAGGGADQTGHAPAASEPVPEEALADLGAVAGEHFRR
jgi:hypothetical protein